MVAPTLIPKSVPESTLVPEPALVPESIYEPAPESAPVPESIPIFHKVATSIAGTSTTAMSSPAPLETAEVLYPELSVIPVTSDLTTDTIFELSLFPDATVMVKRAVYELSVFCEGPVATAAELP